jgi:lysophospholipase
MAKWDNSELVILKDGRHEVLMEVQALRDRVFDGAVALFDAQLAAAT